MGTRTTQGLEGVVFAPNGGIRAPLQALTYFAHLKAGMKTVITLFGLREDVTDTSGDALGGIFDHHLKTEPLRLALT